MTDARPAAKPTIRLYDTATREKRVFEPIDPSDVRMYVCGPTVYDRAHIGNARPVIVFDVLYRLLRHVYGAEHVTYVRNLTDVDDKINARAAERGVPISEVTGETIGWFHEDMAALGALPPTHEPRATQYIDQMIAMIETLIAEGKAYAAEGHALFSVSSFEGYGALSRRAVEDMIAGARVEVAPYKRDPMDFVLWKPSEEGAPGWESPWGYGRPGWHIECSAMSEALLGKNFDIHGGGVDLVFPHHENERAQSLCAHPGSEFARFWMHNGYVQVEGEKMSKSLGNFITVHDLRETVPGEVIRLAMLMAHYRQPFDWTQKLADEARAVLERWRRVIGETPPGEVPATVVEALAADLNTPKAIAEMHSLASAGDAAGLRAAGKLLGLLTPELGEWGVKFVQERFDVPPGPWEELFEDVDVFFVRRPEGISEAVAVEVALLLNIRHAARKKRRFELADRIRNGLNEAGVEIRDAQDGAEWEPLAAFDPAKLPKPEHV